MIAVKKIAVYRRSSTAVGLVLACSLLELGCRKSGESRSSGPALEALENGLPPEALAEAAASPGKAQEPLRAPAGSGTGEFVAKTVRSLKTEAQMQEVVRRAMEQRLEEMVPGADGKQKLMRNGAVVFEGYSLGDASVSSAGAVALAAHDSKLKPAAQAEEDSDFKNGRWQVGISEVWLVQDGRSEKISASGVHAEHPCISPDGTLVAYTSQPLDGSGLPGRLSLSVYDTRSKHTKTVPIASRGRVVPLLWEEGNLAVYNGGWESMERAEVAFLKIKL